MTSAEDLAYELLGGHNLKQGSVEWIRKIQLDAMREGMRRAAKHVYGNETHEDIENTILSVANSLTEQDLQQ